MEFDLQTRLGWLDANHTQQGRAVTVVETSKEGEATVHISAANTLLAVKTTEKNALNYLRQKAVADGTVCEFLADGTVILHLVECKKTVREKSWKHIKKQFHGALLNAFALCGLLNLQQITAIRLYTAYQNDKLSAESSPNPSLIKMPVGSRQPSLARDWRSGSVNIIGYNFEHQKIVLDADGMASLQL